jgi:hypothetical protein
MFVFPGQCRVLHQHLYQAGTWLVWDDIPSHQSPMWCYIVTFWFCSHPSLYIKGSIAIKNMWQNQFHIWVTSSSLPFSDHTGTVDLVLSYHGSLEKFAWLTLEAYLLVPEWRVHMWYKLFVISQPMDIHRDRELAMATKSLQQQPAHIHLLPRWTAAAYIGR